MNVLELKGRRVANGYKQKEVAKSLNITPKTLCIYENSKNCKFTPEQIEILSALYNLTLDDVNHIFFNSSLPNGNKQSIS